LGGGEPLPAKETPFAYLLLHPERPAGYRGQLQMIHPADLKDDEIWEMLSASRAGDLDRVKELVSRRPELARCEYNYTPPIHFAVREGHLSLVRYLLDQGVDLNYKTYSFGDSLLTMARDREYHEIAELLLETLSGWFPVREGINAILDAALKGDIAGLKSNLASDPTLARASNDTGETALHKAAEGGHLDAITTLLDAGANPDAVRSDGLRPINCALRRQRQNPLQAGVVAGALLARGAQYNIYLAAVLGDYQYVRQTLTRDPSLSNFEDTSHSRPISAAAQRNEIQMVKLLLDHGADPSLPEAGSPLGQALWTAVYQRQTEMARLLLEHGANPNTAPESSGSALLHARHDPELRRLLLQYGAEEKSGDLHQLQLLIGDGKLAEVERLLQEAHALDLQDSAFWGEGILCGPAKGADRPMLELLIRHGARVPDVSKWGRYYYFKHYDIAAFLMDNGMNPNHMNWHHVTLLHDMAQEGDIPKARLLLDHGADIDAVDEEYRSTPLGLASRWGRREMVAFLLERGADPDRSGAPWATPLAWAKKKGHHDIEGDLRQAGAQ
jgi:ankyrin repeat protein